MKIIDANSYATLVLGRCGENLARKVVFDITDFENLYGVGTVEVLYQRPNDAQPYPLAVQRDGTSITWNVTYTDTAIPSAFGKCELRYYSGDTLVKSKIWQTWVENALSTPSETTPPEPEQGWVDQVLDAKQTAEKAAVDAKADADRAAVLAAEVAQNASQVAQNVSYTNEAKEAAVLSASEAAQSAQEAAGSASVASTSETNAKASEVSAKAAQKVATESANAAANSAELASEYASAAQQSATSAAESAAVYDTVVADVTQLKQDITAITPDDTTVDGKPWTSKKIVDSLCMPFEETGNPVQVYPAENYPLGVKVSWEPTQEGSGDPSPDNIRPITGRDAVSVVRCGENLLDLVQCVAVTASASYNLTVSKDDTGLISLSGIPNLTKDLPNATFRIYKTYQLMPSGYKAKVFVQKGNVTSAKTIQSDNSIVIMMPLFVNTPVDVEFRMMYYVGAEPTTYTPYTGSTTDIALTETVYGGTLDWNTGVLAVVNKILTLTGNEEWNLNDDDNDKRRYNYTFKGLNATVNFSDKVATHFTSNGVVGVGNGFEFGKYYMSSRQLVIFDKNRHFESLEQFKAYLSAQYAAGTPVQVCYKLNTPYTIQLTPQQIAALSGVNTLYTDADGVIVTGAEDPKHTITELKNAIISLGGNI